jgi:putative spermidine/putrescine transport system permease protein
VSGPPVRRRRRRDPVAWLLGLFVLLFAAFILAPIAIVLVASFSAENFIAFPITGFSARWYARIWEYRPFANALATSVQLALLSAALGAALGVPAALALARSRSGLATAATTFLLAPISIPAVVLGFALLYWLSALAFGVSFRALLVAHTVVAVPYVARTVLSVYRAVPPALEESAAILGASRWQVFRHVTLPLIRPGVFAGCLFAVLISLDNLPLSFFFGTATTNTLPVVVLSYMQNQFDPSIAAISTVQMLIALVTLLAVDRLYGLRRLNAL